MSIGLTRLFYNLMENGIIKTTPKSISQIIVLSIGNTTDYCLNLLSKLRDLNINSTYFPDDTKFKNKLQYAVSQNIPYAIIVGEDEVKNNQFLLKDLNKKEQYVLDLNKINTILDLIK
jgi:histidyl-tRNA synthetase